MFNYAPPKDAKKKQSKSTKKRKLLKHIGKKFPDVMVQDLAGGKIKLSDKLKGKVTLIDYWATWCKPCVAEIPHFVELYKQYKDKGLEIVGLSPEGTDVIKNFTTKEGISYLMYKEAGRPDPLNNISALPTTILIDKAGIVRSIWIGSQSKEAFEQVIKKLLEK